VAATRRVLRLDEEELGRRCPHSSAMIVTMIIRRSASTLHLITQPSHAALSARIMRQWGSGHFAESPRKASILNAIEQHDCGWAEFDETLVIDTQTGPAAPKLRYIAVAEAGRLLDFTEVSDAVKRETSTRGIPPLASDPYAAALAAQHRLHVYRRYADHPEWKPFFAEMTATRNSYAVAAGVAPLDDLLRDYRLVRAGDLASLAFCNEWTNTDDDGCGYSMHFDGSTLTISPDPFDGRVIAIDVEARVIQNERFASIAEARQAVAAAPLVILKGMVRGSDA
jgi:hypothetical protein